MDKSIFIPSLNGFFKNSFHQKLCQELQRRGFLVTTEIESLDCKKDFDIVLLCWPELLQQSLKQSLVKSIMKNHASSKLALLLHNVAQHDDGGHLTHFFNNFKDKFHYIIYLGSAEINNPMISNLMVPGGVKIITRHPQYGPFNNLKSTQDRDNSVCLIGSIRNLTELILLLKCVFVCFLLRLPVKFLGRISLRTNEKLTVIKLIYKIISIVGNLILSKGQNSNMFLNDNELAQRLVRSRFVFIPRINILNSGTAIFALGCGCCVVGPNTGNVGKLLKRAENFSFDEAGTIVTLYRQLSKAKSKCESVDFGRNNTVFCNRILGWSSFSKSLAKLED